MSDTFCILPFVHAATLTDGSMPLCCVADKSSDTNLNRQVIADYWNSAYAQQARQLMLAGKPVTACTRCYEEEKNGYRSHRVIENQAWREKLGEAQFDEIVRNARAGEPTSSGPSKPARTRIASAAMNVVSRLAVVQATSQRPSRPRCGDPENGTALLS